MHAALMGKPSPRQNPGRGHQGKKRQLQLTTETMFFYDTLWFGVRSKNLVSAGVFFGTHRPLGVLDSWMTCAYSKTFTAQAGAFSSASAKAKGTRLSEGERLLLGKL